MSENLRKIIQNQQLFTRKDKMVIGVSGGMDSMVLCTLLYKCGFHFIIAHCNYHLRVSASDADEEFVKNWANQHHIPCFVKSFDLGKKKNLQEEARILRYQFFQDLALKEKCNYILTAHHANDQIETFFINLSRGAGIHGLKGMEPKNGILIRPFLTVHKNEINEYALKYKVHYREDQTNFESEYLRNFIRNQILQPIAERIPSFDKMVLRSMDLLRDAENLIREEFKAWKMKCVSRNGRTIKIHKSGDPGNYLLSLYLSELGFHPETISKIQIAYHQPGKLFKDKSKHELLIDRDFIFIRNQAEKQNLKTYIINDDYGEIRTKAGKFTWELKRMNLQDFQFPGSHNSAVFDAQDVKFPLELRIWLPGDLIKPLGMKGKTKKIQDVFTDKKIPLFKKQKQYLLVSGPDVLWLPGILRSEIGKVDSSTTRYIQLQYHPKD